MRICFFGDSFVNGAGDPLYQGWVGRACARARSRGADITAYNCGIRRATSDDIKASWLSEAVIRLPVEHQSAVVFSFGANDSVMESGQPRVAYQRHMDNTRAILTDAAARWPVVFIASPRCGDDSGQDDPARRAEGARAICAELGVPVLDAYAASGAFEKWHAEAAAGDGAHPNAGGYEELAALIDAWPPWRQLIDEPKPSNT